MNTKKAFWLKRPLSFIKTDLHSFSWFVEDENSVFWTVGEEATFSLNVSKDDSVVFSFVLLHTPTDYVSFEKDGIYSCFFGLKSYFPLKETNISSLKMVKNKDEISFFQGDDLIYKIQNPAFLGSASLGIKAKGNGNIRIEVF